MRRYAVQFAVALAMVAATLAGLRSLARSRTFQLFGDLVPRVETTSPIVALTFDDGPAPATLDGILATLAARDVHATFFVIGGETAAHPDAARRLVAAGHELGNHTWSHTRMVFTSPSTAAAEIERTDAVIRAAGQPEPIWFRPPYGLKTIGLPWYLRQHGRTSVTWDIEPESFPAVASSATAIVTHVLDRVRPGSIILLHPWYATGAPTREALPAVIDRIKAKNLRFVTVGELLRARVRG